MRVINLRASRRLLLGKILSYASLGLEGPQKTISIEGPVWLANIFL